jgi:Nucleotidyl transferase AbiEii toxin, Type IV TA system
VDDLTLRLLETLEQPYQGISFRFDKDKDWYLTEEGCAANPVCAHEANTTGIKIKIQVSMRERPILPVQEAIQIEQSYFKFLAFAPSSIPSLAVEEVIAEKIRAASQRSKIRDLYDLAEIVGEARACNPPREERQTSPPSASEVFGLKVHWPILLPTIRLNECNECDVVIVTQYPGVVFGWIATASS